MGFPFLLFVTMEMMLRPTVVNSKVYQLRGRNFWHWTATIIEKSDATLSVELELKNTVAGASHPAHIHLNTAAEGGDIALSLKAVDGATGKVLLYLVH
jgi:hypothetical protein